MQILRRVFLTFCSAVLGLSLIGLAWSHSLAVTIRDQDTVKSWLAESGFYDELSSSVVEQVATNSGETAANAVRNEEVQQIATNALDSTNVLQTSIEQLLGSVYVWLEGGELPTSLSVDFAEAGQQLSTGLGDYASNRAANLPLCTPQQTMMLQASYDVWTAPCRPEQLSAAQVGETAREEVLASIGAGETDVATSDVFNTENQQQLEQIRNAYQRTRWMPYVLAIVALLSGAGLVFASSERRKGMSRAGWITAVSGVIVGVSAFFISRGPSLARSALKNTDQDQSTIDLVMRLFETAGQDIARLMWRYGALYIALGLILMVVARKVMKRPPTSGSPDSNMNGPTPPIDDSSKTPLPEGGEPQKLPPKPQSPRPPRKIQL